MCDLICDVITCSVWVKSTHLIRSCYKTSGTGVRESALFNLVRNCGSAKSVDDVDLRRWPRCVVRSRQI